MAPDLAALREAFVWTWLPGVLDPVDAGRLIAEGSKIGFVYGRSYRVHADAIPSYFPELPLRKGLILPGPRQAIANAIRDAAPDVWGRRVILNRLFGTRREAIDQAQVDELTFCWRQQSRTAPARSIFRRRPRPMSHAVR